MYDIKVPVNNVCYKIQNLDFGTFIGIVDEKPKRSSLKEARIVIRPEKKDDSTQEWVFREDRDFGDDQWAIVNYRSNFYVENGELNSVGPFVAFFAPGEKLPDSARLTVQRDGDTDAVIIQTKSGILVTTDGANLSFVKPDDYPYYDVDEIPDRMKWRLIPKAPFLVRPGVYVIRTLTGRYLTRYPDNERGNLVTVEAKELQTFGNGYWSWFIKPAEGGKCTILLQTPEYKPTATDYLSCNVKDPHPHYLKKGPAFPWEVRSVGGNGYQFLTNDGEELAINSVNGASTDLTVNLNGQGETWILEIIDWMTKAFKEKNPDAWK